MLTLQTWRNQPLNCQVTAYRADKECGYNCITKGRDNTTGLFVPWKVISNNVCRFLSSTVKHYMQCGLFIPFSINLLHELQH